MRNGTVGTPLAVVAGQRLRDGVAGRVVEPVAVGHGPFHNRADPLPYSLGRFGLGVPDGGEDARDVARRQL